MFQAEGVKYAIGDPGTDLSEPCTDNCPRRGPKHRVIEDETGLLLDQIERHTEPVP